jgi:hypothetical protein
MLKTFLLTSLVFFACSRNQMPKDLLESKLSRWIGSTETDIINHYGLPNRTYIDASDVKYITFERSNNYILHYTKNSATGLWHCSVTFSIDPSTKKISGYLYDGNDCYKK